MQNTSDLPKCKKCGDTVPTGKELCWCCEHAPKLRIDNKKDCQEDSCTIVFDKR